MPELTGESLVEGVRGGDPRAIARTISLIEDGDSAARELIRLLHPFAGRAATVGVTGSPGVGKSTLAAALVRMARSEGRTVGVISVDPSSAFSKGALLGDRIRLGEHALDPGVFIRSMATRGHKGGIAEATLLAALVLDAAGKDLVLVETVGVGQGEVEIAHVCDTVVLVLMPGAGDSIQALKAGIMEIPDVIVVNKSDHLHARTTASEVRAVLALGPARAWTIPVILTDAIRGVGLEELARALEGHRLHLEQHGRLEERRRRGLHAEILALAASRIASHVERMAAEDPAVRGLLERVERRELDPATAVQEIVNRALEIERPEITSPGGAQPPPDNPSEERAESSSTIKRTP